MYHYDMCLYMGEKGMGNGESQLDTYKYFQNVLYLDSHTHVWINVHCYDMLTLYWYISSNSTHECVPPATNSDESIQISINMLLLCFKSIYLFSPRNLGCAFFPQFFMNCFGIIELAQMLLFAPFLLQ